MNKIKTCGRALIGLGLVVLGAYILLASFVIPSAKMPSSILSYVSVMLVVSLAWEIVFFVPRMVALSSAKQSNCKTIFVRAFEEFKVYCIQRKKGTCYISRFLMHVFTVLVIAALVVKGSIAVATLLSVAFIAEGAISSVMSKVVSGKATSDTVLKATS